MEELDKREILDISPLVSEKLAVFPGDTNFEREVLMDFKKGNHLVLSAIKTTVHVGAHADAPGHYHPAGQGIDERPLFYYLGPTTVVELSLPPKTRITPEHFSKCWREEAFHSRILLKTSSFPDPFQWSPDFNALTPELVHFLADRGGVLIGIDTPSIDLACDSELLSHKAIYERDMAILEGLVLDHITPGHYFLSALPLKLEGSDASPVRAILLPLSTFANTKERP